MNINRMKRWVVFGAVVALALCAMAPAAVAAGSTSITVTVTVDNTGFGTATPSDFTYHVLDTSDLTEVATGNFEEGDGTTSVTVISVPPGTYIINEDDLGGNYTLNTDNCSGITVDDPNPGTCDITNTAIPSVITITAMVNNTSGGTATPDQFTYHVLDSGDQEVATGNFDPTGLATVNVAEGTYHVTEDPIAGYNLDVTNCATVAVSPSVPASCVVVNTFGTGEPTTTTLPVTTTFPPGEKQVQISGSANYVNQCSTHLEPPVLADATNEISATISSDAFPQPHKGDPIELTGTEAALSIPASILQVGVSAGIIKDGQQVPSVVTVNVAGDGTKEGTHKYVANVTATIEVNAQGQALPLTSTLELEDTTWTPANDQDPVTFAESSLTIVATLDLRSTVLGQIVTATFTCTTATAGAFISLGAQGPFVPPPATGGGGGGGGNGTGGTGTTEGSLPVTGGSPLPWFALATVSTSLGLLALGTSRRRGRSPNR